MLALFIANKIEHHNSGENEQKIINLLHFKIKIKSDFIGQLSKHCMKLYIVVRQKYFFVLVTFHFKEVLKSVLIISFVVSSSLLRNQLLSDSYQE